ncbi:MAG TPA: CaiB/BaiF CoA-transferase family protein [Mycobacteriales bacterium]
MTASWPDAPPHPGPLSGVRVLDLSRVLAGPYAAMVLSDLGADVIKVERPAVGDDTRHWGPPFHGPDATYFLSVNRNRRALAVDLSQPEGLAVVKRLADGADVVLENFLPRHLRKMGLDAVRDESRSTWVSVRGASSNGIDGENPGYDVMAQARSGLMHITGAADGPATKVGVAIADVVTGLHAAVAAVAGVAARARGGAAPTIEVPLLESMIAALVNQSAAALNGGIDPMRMGNEHPSVVPYGPLPTADVPLVIGAANDGQFQAFTRVLGRPDLATDPRFATNRDRVENRAVLLPLLVSLLVARPAADWAAELVRAGVPSAPVNTVADALADPHVAAAGLVVESQHDGTPVRLVASPFLVDGVRPSVRTGPPAIGADTDEVLAGLGFSATAIDDLRGRGVVA